MAGSCVSGRFVAIDNGNAGAIPEVEADAARFSAAVGNAPEKREDGCTLFWVAAAVNVGGAVMPSASGVIPGICSTAICFMADFGCI